MFSIAKGLCLNNIDSTDEFFVWLGSPEMDYQSLGNIFKGLAASGSWGCFDEFNRLIPEVLSVCTVQFKAVCDGTTSYDHDSPTHYIMIEGDQINLDPTCGAFITMNPVGPSCR